MSNPKISTLLAAVSLLPMTAFAENLVPVSLTIEYDPAALSTNQGAVETMDAISEASKAACKREQSITATSSVDMTCANELFEQAVRKIASSNVAAGLAVAPAFTDSAETVLASHEQR